MTTLEFESFSEEEVYQPILLNPDEFWYVENLQQCLRNCRIEMFVFLKFSDEEKYNIALNEFLRLSYEIQFFLVNIEIIRKNIEDEEDEDNQIEIDEALGLDIEDLEDEEEEEFILVRSDENDEKDEYADCLPEDAEDDYDLFLKSLQKTSEEISSEPKSVVTDTDTDTMFDMKDLTAATFGKSSFSDIVKTPLPLTKECCENSQIQNEFSLEFHHKILFFQGLQQSINKWRNKKNMKKNMNKNKNMNDNKERKNFLISSMIYFVTALSLQLTTVYFHENNNIHVVHFDAFDKFFKDENIKTQFFKNYQKISQLHFFYERNQYSPRTGVVDTKNCTMGIHEVDEMLSRLIEVRNKANEHTMPSGNDINFFLSTSLDIIKNDYVVPELK